MPNAAAPDPSALGGSLRHKAAGGGQARGNGGAWPGGLPRSVQSVDGGGGGGRPTRRAFGRALLLRSRSRGALSAWWRWWLVGADMTLIALMPVLVHLSKTPSGAYPYHPAAVNLLVEAAKTVVAAASLAWAGRAGWAWAGGKRDGAAPHPHHPGWGGAALASRARRARALAAPAALYALNGYLKFALQAHFSPTAARVLGSLKVVAIALLLRCLTGRRFSTVQVQALALMAAGVAVHGVSRRECGGAAPPAPAAAAATAFPPTAGSPAALTPRIAATVAAAVAVPSLAAVLAERGMKADPAAAVQEQTFWLCAFGLAANGVGLAAVKALGGSGGAQQGGSSIFAGTASPAIAALIAVSAAQGVLAGVFYKSIDAIAKKLSSVGATALTAVFSAVFLGQAALTPGLGLAALILGIATHQFYVGGAAAAATGSGKGEPGGLALTASPPGSGAAIQDESEAARATPAKLRRPLAGMA